MPLQERLHAAAPYVLRYGLAALYLWFGFTQLASPDAWTGWMPEWATNLTGLDARTLVLMNGALESVLGAFLALGIVVRAAAAILAAHMALIVFEIGLNPTGVRDFAIAAATLALALQRRPRPCHQLSSALHET